MSLNYFQVIPNANVPIITIKDKEKSFESDITVQNWNSARNAFLLKCYSECDRRVKPLVIVIKLWAQKAAIVGAKLKRLPGKLFTVSSMPLRKEGVRRWGPKTAKPRRKRNKKTQCRIAIYQNTITTETAEVTNVLGAVNNTSGSSFH